MMENFIFNTLNSIRTLMKQGVIDEANGNAIITASWIYCNFSGIKKDPRYFPDIEIQMIIDAISSLPPESNLMPHLVSQLIDLAENLVKKTNVSKTQQNLGTVDHYQHVLENAVKILTSLPNNAFTLIDLTQHSPELRQLFAEDFFLDKKILKRTPEEFYNLIDVSVSHQMNPYTRDDYLDNLQKSGRAIKEAIRQLMSGDVKIAKKALNEIFLHFENNNIISTNMLGELIQFMAEQYPHKEVFVIYVLSIYQQRFNNENAKKDILLRGMTILLPVLGQLIDADKFFVLIKKFKLEKKYDTLSYNEIKYVETYMLITGQMIPTENLEKKIAAPENLLQVLRILGKSSLSNKLLLSSTDKCHGIPDQLLSLAQEIDSLASVEKLITHLRTTNSNAPLYQQRNITLLCIKYHMEILLFIYLAGEVAIKHMRSLVANTVLPLEKMLETCPKLDAELMTLMKDYCQSQVTTIKAFETFKLCLTTISLLQKFNELSNDSMSLSLEDLIRGAIHKSPDDFLNELVKSILGKILPNLEMQLDEETIKICFKRCSVEKLINLMAATQKMQDDPYKEIYLELLKIDLLGGDPDIFLHDTEQDSPLGQDLARHNQKIQASLLAHGIDPDEALHYQKTYDLILLPANTSVEQLSIDHYYLVLWRYIYSLKDEINKINQSQLDENTQKKIQLITSNIQQIESKINRQCSQGSNETNAANSVLSKPDVINSIVGKNIVENCIFLKKNKIALSNSFFEFSDHVCAQFNLLTQHSSKEAPPKSSIKPTYIEIAQWSKDQIDTFFLGDEVGCCLATNGHQFQAIVQRRMDDAMLFHVATDKTTNKPVALIWLYLAETSDNQIVLMANFFEVKTKFGEDVYKRSALLNALLQFTNQYLDDNPGISGFYMNRLNYGWNKGDLDSYPVKPLSLSDKVGGPYIPEETSEELGFSDPEKKAESKLLTQQKYYLVSLSNSEFHQFSPTILRKGMHENIVPIAKLMHDLIFELTKSKVTFNVLLQQVIQKHGIILEQFYGKPLNTNQKFLNVVDQEYVNATIFHETGGKHSLVDLLKQEHAFFKRISTNPKDKAPSDDEKSDNVPKI